MYKRVRHTSTSTFNVLRPQAKINHSLENLQYQHNKTLEQGPRQVISHRGTLTNLPFVVHMRLVIQSKQIINYLTFSSLHVFNIYVKLLKSGIELIGIGFAFFLLNKYLIAA